MGRELDRLVATRVMGWRLDPDPNMPRAWQCREGERWVWAGYLAADPMIDDDGVPDIHPICGTRRFDPSSSIASAWEVVEKMRADEFALRLLDQTHRTRLWDCRFYKYPESTAIEYQSADTAPLAISLAALRACGEPEETIQAAIAADKEADHAT